MKHILLAIALLTCTLQAQEVDSVVAIFGGASTAIMTFPHFPPDPSFRTIYGAEFDDLKRKVAELEKRLQQIYSNDGMYEVFKSDTCGPNTCPYCESTDIHMMKKDAFSPRFLFECKACYKRFIWIWLYREPIQLTQE